MGGHFAIPITQTDNLEEAVRLWRGRILVADANAGGQLFATDLTGDTAVILGGEAAGVQPALAAMATGALGIPMPGAVESLNVGAAGAVICFERLRQVLATTKG